MLMSTLIAALQRARTVWIAQRFEKAEMFGFETRNKYVIRDESGQEIAYAAEQGKGLLALLARGFAGHWRTFELHLFDTQRQPVARAVHPFRWYFQRLDVYRRDDSLAGSLQQRWAWFSKRFDVLGPQGEVLLTVDSPIWKPWTFPFLSGGQEVAAIRKRWTGFGAEMFTDKDTFQLEYLDANLATDLRVLLVLAAVFVDLQYFERKANR